MSKPEQFILRFGVAEGIKRLNNLGLLVLVVTNQSGISRGFFTFDDLMKIHKRMSTEIENTGGKIDAIYYCPHHPNDKCTCRKPGINMLIKAKNDFNIDLSNCYLIGNKKSDIEAGLRAKCTTILIPGTQTETDIASDYSASDFSDAVKFIENTLG